MAESEMLEQRSLQRPRHQLARKLGEPFEIKALIVNSQLRKISSPPSPPRPPTEQPAS